MEAPKKMTELIPQSSIELMKTALHFLDTMQKVNIRTQDEYENAVGICKQIKSHINSLEKDRRSLVAPYNKKVTAINGKYKDVTSKLKNGDEHIRLAMREYHQEQVLKRQEEQRKREAEAAEIRRKAEKKARLEAEKAAKYREMGREEMAEKAEARVETAVEVAQTTVAPEVEEKKVSGVSYRTKYECVVEDKKTAIHFLVDNPMFIDHVIVDTKAIERAAQAFKGKLEIPGLKINITKIPNIYKDRV